MRILIIGGSGHIGSYLVPRLVSAGHEVINVSRQKRKPYVESEQWQVVRTVEMDRHAEDKAGTFAGKIAALGADVVIDNICFTVASARLLAEALRGRIKHLLVTGTIWVHGEAELVPTPESAMRRPIGEYGIQKNAIERYLIDESGVPSTIVHPGHIVGPGWPCVNPQGHFNLDVWRTIRAGQKLTLPNWGLECLHHVHADDVAQVFASAVAKPDRATGQAFHAVSGAAVTLLGYARAAFAWFGRKENIDFAPAEELAARLAKEDGNEMLEHIRRSPCMSIAKGRELLGYAPRHTSLEACREAVDWQIKSGRL